MEPRLIQSQSQKLILSPQIRQYLKLLQLPIMELQQAVETELQENPMLEEAGSDGSADSPGPGDTAAPEKERSAEELRLGETFDKLDRLDDHFRDGMSDYGDASSGDTSDLQKRKNFQESLITKQEGLADFLVWQLRFLDLKDNDLKIAEEIIGNIDDNGFLKATLEEIAASCHSTPGHVESILKTLQTMDPPGVGARDLREALLLQLERKEGVEIAAKIVADHLKHLEKRDWKQLSRILGVDLEQVKEAAEIIAQLEPRPGRIFYAEESLAVVPEATVSLGDEENGKLKLEVHGDTVRHLRLNPYYRKLIRDKKTDSKTRLFLRDKMQNALNFIRAIKLRKSTIQDITEEIIKAQYDFFEQGFAHLKPLRLKDIAQNLGVHESTVSRALQGKYILTPQGMIPYKSFFSARLETEEGESESQKSIMEKIRHMVDKETPEEPLSDQELVSRLNEQGIRIARRTVAKYRDLLKILPSHLRRRK